MPKRSTTTITPSPTSSTKPTKKAAAEEQEDIGKPVKSIKKQQKRELQKREPAATSSSSDKKKRNPSQKTRFLQAIGVVRPNLKTPFWLWYVLFLLKNEAGLLLAKLAQVRHCQGRYPARRRVQNSAA